MRASIRVWLALLMLGFGGTAWAQGREDNWARCRNADPDTGIAGCTAIIEASGGSARDRALAFNNRGNARFRKGDYDHAIEDYDQALKLDPNEPTAYDGRGSVYYGKGQYELAAQDYDQAIRLDASDAYAFAGRCNARTALGQYESAIADDSSAH